MATNIDRVEARAKLKPRRDPYWKRIAEGRYVGYRRLTASSAGTWQARYYNGKGYSQKRLGAFLNQPEKARYDAAKKEAEEWFRHMEMGGTTDRLTVKGACEAYVDKLNLERPNAAADAKARFGRLVYDDPLARVELQKLAARHLADWKKRTIEKGGTLGSFNRNATPLRAALNLALKRRDVASDHAWVGELKPFEDADGQRKLYLKHVARLKLLEKAAPESQAFIKALMLVPFRPGDVAKLKVEHFNVHTRELLIPAGKSKVRRIPLPAEAVKHFKDCAKDKLPGAWLVSRASGGQWHRFAWRDAINEAVADAKLPPAVCAYTLRHSVITDLVTGGLDLFTVARISGTSIVMIEKHYGQLQDKVARAALKKLAMS